VETISDQSLKPMLEQEASNFHQIFEQFDKTFKTKPIEVVSNTPNTFDQWFLRNNNNKIPAINKLSGFKSWKDDMHSHYRQLYMYAILNNDIIK